MLLDDPSLKDDIANVRDTLSARVADLLRDWILVEKLAPRQVLAERELSEFIGVSRTPLREALRILAAEGLVEMVPNRRPRVADPTLEQLLDLLDVLAALESLAGEKAAGNIDPADIAAMERIIDRLANFPQDGDPLDYFRLDMEFHRTIVRASSNDALIKTHAQYNAAVFRARFMSTRWATRRPLMQQQHAGILEALKQGDGQATAARIHEHLMQLKQNISELYADNRAARSTDTKPRMAQIG